MNVFISDVTSPDGILENIPRKRKLSVTPEEKSAEDNLIELATRSLLRSDDEFTAFGNAIAAELRGIQDSYTRDWLKMNIYKLIFDTKTGWQKP